MSVLLSKQVSMEAGHLAPEDREPGHVRRVEPVAHTLQAAVAVLAATAEGEATVVALGSALQHGALTSEASKAAVGRPCMADTAPLVADGAEAAVARARRLLPVLFARLVDKCDVALGGPCF